MELTPIDGLSGAVLQAKFVSRDKKRSSNRWVSGCSTSSVRKSILTFGQRYLVKVCAKSYHGIEALLTYVFSTKAGACATTSEFPHFIFFLRCDLKSLGRWRDAEDFTVGLEVIKFWEAADLKDHQGSDDAEGFEVGENIYLRSGEKKRLIRISSKYRVWDTRVDETV